jgi:hypothetical protein
VEQSPFDLPKPHWQTPTAQLLSRLVGHPTRGMLFRTFRKAPVRTPALGVCRSPANLRTCSGRRLRQFVAAVSISDCLTCRDPVAGVGVHLW